MLFNLSFFSSIDVSLVLQIITMQNGVIVFNNRSSNEDWINLVETSNGLVIGDALSLKKLGVLSETDKISIASGSGRLYSGPR